jgi:NTP pyrophosphatase (non-canonical NTP hydrolase)
MSDLADLTEEILRFRDERDWAQFHTPRNLAAALAIEAGEVQELMLWKQDRSRIDAVSFAKALAHTWPF